METFPPAQPAHGDCWCERYQSSCFVIPWCLPSQELKGHHWQEITAVTTAAAVNWTSWASNHFFAEQRLPGSGWGGFALLKRGDFKRQVLLIQSHRLTAAGSPWGAQQVQPEHGAFWMGDVGDTHSPDSPGAAQIASLCYLPVCNSGSTAGAAARISVEALILFILQPKLGHQCCQEACFFALIHAECIFNAVSAVLYRWAPMWCITAARALQ